MYVELQCTEYMLYITNIHCLQCLAPILHHPTLYYTIYTAILHFTQLFYIYMYWVGKIVKISHQT